MTEPKQDVSVLGDLQLNGVSHRLPPQQAVLLAMLLGNDQHKVTSTELREAFDWRANRDRESARTTLVSSLRQALGWERDAIQPLGEGAYRLRLDLVAVDWLRLESLLEAQPVDEHALRLALTNCRGELLANHEHFGLGPYRDQQRDLYFKACERLVQPAYIEDRVQRLLRGDTQWLLDNSVSGKPPQRRELEWLDVTAAERRHVSGSRRLLVRDVLESDRLLMPFPWTADPFARRREVDDLAEHILAGVPERRQFLVLSGPGFGKSLLSILLIRRMNERGPLRGQRIDLYEIRDFWQDDDFGSSEWLHANGIDPETLVLDGLDEFLAGRDAREMAGLMARPLFRDAAVITCRQAFFQQYLSYSAVADRYGREQCVLMAWTEIEVGRFIAGYFHHLSEKYPAMVTSENDVGSLINAATRFLDSEPITGMLNSPLRVIMALEIVDLDQSVDESRISTVLDFYRVFVDRVLARETGKPGNLLTPDQKRQLLSEVAWQFFDDTAGGSDDVPVFTSGELKAYLRASSIGDEIVGEEHGSRELLERDRGLALSRIHEDLEERTVLDRMSAWGDADDRTLAFAHKTLQDYFVARRLFTAIDRAELTSGGHTLAPPDTEGSALEAARMFLRLASPAVSEFLKEHIDSTRSQSKTLLNRLGRRLLYVREVLESLRPTSPDELGRQRLALGQLLYYLGVASTRDAVEYLQRRRADETDAWLSRSIVVGLAFTGDLQPLGAYVDALRNERTSGPPFHLNDENLGFHFSFFGDQPLDPQRPERDQGLQQCENTVNSLIYQLSRPITSATWMIDLYTLIDLWRNVPWAKAIVEFAARTHVESLRTTRDVLDEHEQARKWPELEDLRELVRLARGSSGLRA